MSTPARPDRPEALPAGAGGASPAGPLGKSPGGDPPPVGPPPPARSPGVGDGGTEKERLGVAFEAILGLAGCLDQMIRELRRSVTIARWREVQDEVTRVRRLVMARPEPKEGPPRDEGPASQPPPPPV